MYSQSPRSVLNTDLTFLLWTAYNDPPSDVFMVRLTSACQNYTMGGEYTKLSCGRGLWISCLFTPIISLCIYWDQCGKVATVAVHVSCTKGAYLLVVARGKMSALLQNWDMPQEEETEDDNPMRLSAYDVDQNIVSSC